MICSLQPPYSFVNGSVSAFEGDIVRLTGGVSELSLPFFELFFPV